MVTREEWRVVRDCPDYEISNIGGLRRITPSRGTSVGKVRKPTLLNGYVAYCVKVHRKTVSKYAHRMVADAFLGPIPPGMQVNHKNGDRADCRVENLEIVTNAENRAHSYRVLGVKPNRATGELCARATLTWEIVDAIRASDELAGVLGRRYGVSRNNIWRVRTQKIWRDEDRPSIP